MTVTETKMRPMTPVQLRAHLQRILKRALEMDLPSQVKLLDGTTYQVPSTSRGNVIHLVEAHALPLLCTCEAFGHMPLCVHRAAVLLKRWANEGKTVALNEVGDVVVRSEVDASTLAYPAEQYPALVLPFDAPTQAKRTPLSYRIAPTVSEYHADLLFDLDEFASDDLLLDLDGDV